MWRTEFARHLREQGVPANATERAVRGENRVPRRDGTYRTQQRGESWRLWERVEEAGLHIHKMKPRTESGKKTLVETRKKIEQGWWALSDILVAQGASKLSADVKRFVDRMPPSRSDQEMIADELQKNKKDLRTREGPTR